MVKNLHIALDNIKWGHGGVSGTTAQYSSDGASRIVRRRVHLYSSALRRRRNHEILLYPHRPRWVLEARHHIQLRNRRTLRFHRRIVNETRDQRLPRWAFRKRHSCKKQKIIEIFHLLKTKRERERERNPRKWEVIGYCSPMMFCAPFWNVGFSINRISEMLNCRYLENS